jgi:dCTP deaminase
MPGSETTYSDAGLFPDVPAVGTESIRTTGILPSQEISNLIARGNIAASPAINPDHIQPASLDLRLGDMAHRVRASFLAGPNSTVAEKIK